MLTKAAFIWYKYSKKYNNIVKNLYNFGFNTNDNNKNIYI